MSSRSDYDARGHLVLPIATGLVLFVRKVDNHGRIEFKGTTSFIRGNLERQYVVATLSSLIGGSSSSTKKSLSRRSHSS